MLFKFDLSVIIISRNEEKNIERCIKSILKATQNINSEIILVDSASTDKTVEIAMNYSIRIIQLHPDWPMSAAAGRYIGYICCHGKYLQFQDSDTILDEDWFRNAIPELEKDIKLAGVVGIITQEKYNNALARNWDNRNKNEKFGLIDSYHEDILLKKEAILEVKPFNPYLKAIEEGEFSCRLLDKGYKLLRLPFKMSHHLGGEIADFSSILKRKMIATIAYGQILRYSMKNKRIFWFWVKTYKFIILVSMIMIFGLFMILLSKSFTNIIPIYLWILAIFLLFLDIYYESKNIKFAFNHFLSISLRWPYLIWGFLQTPQNPDDYPRDVIILK